MCYRFPLQVYVHKYTTIITSVCVNLVISSNCPSWLGLIIRPKRGGFTSEYVISSPSSLVIARKISPLITCLVPDKHHQTNHITSRKHILADFIQI